MPNDKKINIFGAGVMGQQIAALFVLLGYNVSIHTKQELKTDKILAQSKLLRRLFKSDIEIQGSIQCHKYENIGSFDKKTIGASVDALAEDLALKKTLFKKIREQNDELFLTNTSSLSPSEIGDDVVGMHFFNPINIQLVETTDCPNIFKPTLQGIINDLGMIGFQCIKVQQNRGYIGNKILFAEISTVLSLIEKDGYHPSSVSNIYGQLNPGRNIFNIIDLIGIDLVKIILENLAEIDDGFYVAHCLDSAIRRNILGKKNRTSILDLYKEQ